MNETRAEMALVSTSSICQGEQVALLWPRIFKAANVKFAYVPFKWANAAARNAGVWCTIIGLCRENRSTKLLFENDSVRECSEISPYLVPGQRVRSEEHTSELQSLMRISYAVFCLKKKKQ